MSSNLAQQYLVHLDSIIRMYDDALKESENSFITKRDAYGIIARAESAIEKISGRHSPYVRQMVSILDEDSHPSYKAEIITGIVAALKGDIQDGYLASLTELVHGEVFKNFLQMSEYLLSKGFKDAAAVIAGSTLEAHLRQLCSKYGIDMEQTLPDGRRRPKKAEQLNQDLAKVAHSLFEQKQVTAWLDLRNSAAHGKYMDYSRDQVEQFTEWLQHFIETHPA
jgi:hypothetical protein